MANPSPLPSVPPETDAEREARFVWERARLAEAEEDFAAGRFMPDEELDAWLDKWAAGEDVR